MKTKFELDKSQTTIASSNGEMFTIHKVSSPFSNSQIVEVIQKKMSQQPMTSESGYAIVFFFYKPIVAEAQRCLTISPLTIIPSFATINIKSKIRNASYISKSIQI